jgi:AcrR family transcriptional regulator
MKERAAYHSPLREEQAAATRARIIEACASIMQAGTELTYAAVAAEAGVQERTVYRHFPTRNDLQTGLWDWILTNLTHVDFGARTTDEVVSAMRSSFAGFDAGAPLIQAMLHSPQGLEVRQGQQPRRRVMFEACIDAAVPQAPADVRLGAAAALQVLYSASSWELLRSFWGLDATHAADAIELAIRSMLTGLQVSFGGEMSERAPPAPRDATTSTRPATTDRLKLHQSTTTDRQSRRSKP